MTGASRSVTCPSCGGSIEIKAAGYTVNVGCQYCGSVLDVADPDVKLISEFQMAARKLELPLGSRGTLDGIEWEVIGYLERSDDESNWAEYLLFNPYGGYRWIIRADGYWSLGTMLPEEPADAFASAVTWRGKRFSREYDAVTTRTDYVLGEFYWRVKTGDTVQAGFFEASDESSLSCEKSADETSWTYVEDLPEVMVTQGFRNPDGSALNLTGGPAAPTPAPQDYVSSYKDPNKKMPKGEWGLIWKMAFGTMAACLLVMLMFGMGSTLAKNQIAVVLDAPARSYTIGTITLTRGYQPVSITAKSVERFDNKWIDLDYSLVNKATQESIDGYSVVEHYSGVDSDGGWSEGSYSKTAKFSGVPAGTYDVQVEAAMHTWASGGSTYSSGNYNPWVSQSGETYHIDISAGSGGVFWGNFVVTVLLLLGIPLFMFFRRFSN
ncbi:MAG: DUF4178 domain-containing protein [Novosphingobium sp.]